MSRIPFLMNTEFPEYRDQVPQASKPGEQRRSKDPYPPKDQKQVLAKIRAKEQAQTAKEDPDQILQQLEACKESPAQRSKRLGEFVKNHLSDICPPKCHSLAVDRCKIYEDNCRDLFEEPDLVLSEEDARDPELKSQIASVVAEISENDEAITDKKKQSTKLASKIDDQKTKQSKLSDDIAKAENKQVKATQAVQAKNELVTQEAKQVERQKQDNSNAKTARNIERQQAKIVRTQRQTVKAEQMASDITKRDVQTKRISTQSDVQNKQEQKRLQLGNFQNEMQSSKTRLKANTRDVQDAQSDKLDKSKEQASVQNDEALIKAQYPEPLRSQHGGSIGAMRALRGIVKSPKTIEKIDAVLGMISALQQAIPEKSAVITQMINRSHLDLSATTPMQIFAGFLAQADQSKDLSDEEKGKLRQLLHGRERLKSGSDIEKALAQGRGVKTHPDGSQETLAYDKDHPLPLRPGVDAYMQGGREIIQAKAGSNIPAQIDVTGWPTADKADLAEVMSFWTATEAFGLTGFVQDIYALNLAGFFGASEFNRTQVVQMKQTISQIYGGGEGYDGDIGSFDQRMGLIQFQARLLSETGQATGLENDQASSNRMVAQLGLKDKGGNPNPDILKAFGAYTQRHYLSSGVSRADLQAHLHARFPDQAVAPKGDQTEVS